MFIVTTLEIHVMSFLSELMHGNVIRYYIVFAQSIPLTSKPHTKREKDLIISEGVADQSSFFLSLHKPGLPNDVINAPVQYWSFLN